MYCEKCGMQMDSGEKFCSSCGAAAAPAAEKPVLPVNTGTAPEQKAVTGPQLPYEYQPLGPWAYFWLQVLFSVPIVGFICLIVFSFSENINRRNFARSYWCGLLVVLLLVLLVILIVVIISLITRAGLASIADSGNYYY